MQSRNSGRLSQSWLAGQYQHSHLMSLMLENGLIDLSERRYPAFVFKIGVWEFCQGCNDKILCVTVFDISWKLYIYTLMSVTVFDTNWNLYIHTFMSKFIHLYWCLYLYILFIHCSVRAFCQGCNNKILCVTVVDTSWNLYIFSLSPKFNTRFTWKFKNI